MRYRNSAQGRAVRVRTLMLAFVMDADELGRRVSDDLWKAEKNQKKLNSIYKESEKNIRSIIQQTLCISVWRRNTGKTIWTGAAWIKRLNKSQNGFKHLNALSKSSKAAYLSTKELKRSWESKTAGNNRPSPGDCSDARSDLEGWFDPVTSASSGHDRLGLKTISLQECVKSISVWQNLILPMSVQRSVSMLPLILRSTGVSHASDGDRLTSNTHGRRLSSTRMSKPYNSASEWRIHRMIFTFAVKRCEDCVGLEPKQLPRKGMNILQAVAMGSSAEMSVLMMTSSMRIIMAVVSLPCCRNNLQRHFR